MAPQLKGIARLAAAAEPLEKKRVTGYFQLPSFKLLNRCSSERMPFAWTINPYRGCEFGCKYCYARYTHEFMELKDPYEFEWKIFAKQWNPSAFREDLRRIDRRESIALGTATDPYQPAERRYGLTRAILEVFSGMEGYRLGIATKSDLIARDRDLLVEVAKRNQLCVNMTVTTVDVDLARQLEPRAPRPDLRLGALRQLADAGIRCGVLCCPLMPFINDAPEQLEAVAQAAVEAGAQWMSGNGLYLTPLPRAVFLEWVDAEFPQFARKYHEHYDRNVYLRGPAEARLRERITRVREKYGLVRRAEIWEDDVWVEPQMTLGFDAAK